MRRAGWTMAALALVAVAACQKAAAPASNAAVTAANAVAPAANGAVANTVLATASSDAADAKAFVEGLYTTTASTSPGSPTGRRSIPMRRRCSTPA